MHRWKLALSAIGVWFLLAAIAIGCGAARETLLAPHVGPRLAHIVGTLVVVALMGIVIGFYVRLIRVSHGTLLLMGAFWLLLTVAFEFGFGHYVLGQPWNALRADYNLHDGRLWVLVLATVAAGPILAGVKHNRLASRLIVIQVVGVSLGALAATSEIESILVSGPLMSFSGAAIALASYRAGRPDGFYFGLAAPTVAVVCFAIICGLEWSPSDARWPIGLLLAHFALIHLPAGIYAFREAQDVQRPAQRRRVQFSIAAILVTTLAAALFLGAFRTENQQAIAGVAFAAYAVFVGYVVRGFHRGSSMQTLPRPSAPWPKPDDP